MDKRGGSESNGYADPPARQITSLSGTYKVMAMPWLTEAQCFRAIQLLEEEGAIPFRSIDRRRVQCAAGGRVIELGGWHYDVVIFGKTIGVIWQECPAVIEMERKLEFERGRRVYQEKGFPLCAYPDELLAPEERIEVAERRRQANDRLEAEEAVDEAEEILRAAGGADGENRGGR